MLNSLQRSQRGSSCKGEEKKMTYSCPEVVFVTRRGRGGANSLTNPREECSVWGGLLWAHCSQVESEIHSLTPGCGSSEAVDESGPSFSTGRVSGGGGRRHAVIPLNTSAWRLVPSRLGTVISLPFVSPPLIEMSLATGWVRPLAQ